MSENNEIPDFPQELLESMSAIGDMARQQADMAAVQLYRAMFRHERNLNTLDQWADRVLDGVTWSDESKEDYQNYIQYIEYYDKKLGQEYRQMYEKTIKEDIDEDEFDE